MNTAVSPDRKGKSTMARRHKAQPWGVGPHARSFRCLLCLVPITVMAAVPALAKPNAPQDEGLKELMRRVKPAVVQIFAEGPGTSVSGSGVFVDLQMQLIATNAHVIEGCESIKGIIDGSPSELSLVALEPRWDLAILKPKKRINGAITSLRPALEEPIAGESVYALGYPLGLGYTVNRGIVSGIRRMSDLPSGTSVDGEYDPDSTWVQTDCPINHGNSGGPLIDSSGSLLGLNTMFLTTENEVYLAIGARHIRALMAKVDASSGAAEAIAIPRRPREVVHSAKWPGTEPVDGAGYLQVNCEPGSDVFIDGVEVCTLPEGHSAVVISGVPAGKRIIKVQRTHFSPMSKACNVTPDGVAVQRFENLIPRTSALRISTVPVEAFVSIRGPVSGGFFKSDPAHVLPEVPNGDYLVTAEGLGKSISKEVRIVGDAEINLLFNLVTGEVRHSPLTFSQVILREDGSEESADGDFVGTWNDRVRVTCYCTDPLMTFVGKPSVSITGLNPGVRFVEGRADKIQLYEPRAFSDRIEFEYRSLWNHALRSTGGVEDGSSASLSLTSELEDDSQGVTSQQFVVPVYYAVDYVSPSESFSGILTNPAVKSGAKWQVKGLDGRKAFIKIGDTDDRIKGILGIARARIRGPELGPGSHYHYKKFNLLLTFSRSSGRVTRIAMYAGR
jgi:hypothetical protein